MELVTRLQVEEMYKCSSVAWVEDMDSAACKLDSAARAAELTGRVDACEEFTSVAAAIRSTISRLADRYSLNV